MVRLKPDTTYVFRGAPRRRSCQSRPTIRASIGEAQKRRSGRTDLVRPTPVGSIATHEATVNRAAASVFPRRESEVGVTRGTMWASEVRLKPDTTYAPRRYVIAIMNTRREADGSTIRGVCARRLPSDDDVGVQFAQHRCRSPQAPSARGATGPTHCGGRHTRADSIATGRDNQWSGARHQ